LRGIGVYAKICPIFAHIGLVLFRGQLDMETVKTASFEYLIDLAKEDPAGGYNFVLDGVSYHIDDVLEISAIARKHDYIVIY
jgi:hypothetical protein